MADNEVTNQESVKLEKRPQNKLTPEQQKRQQQILVVLIVVAVIGALIILYNNGLIGGSAGREPVEKYLKAIAAKDFDAYVESMPTRMAKDYFDDRYERGITGEEFMSLLYSDYYEEFGDDMTVELDFGPRLRLGSDYIDSFKYSYERLYGEQIRFSSCFEIDVTAHFSGTKSDDYIELECYVIRSGGKWYIVGCDYKTKDVQIASLT